MIGGRAAVNVTGNTGVKKAVGGGSGIADNEQNVNTGVKNAAAVGGGSGIAGNAQNDNTGVKNASAVAVDKADNVQNVYKGQSFGSRDIVSVNTTDKDNGFLYQPRDVRRLRKQQSHSAVVDVRRNLWICAIHGSRRGSRCAIYGSILCAGIHGSRGNLWIELCDSFILRIIQYSWRRHYMDRFVIFSNLTFYYFTYFNGPLQSTEQNHRPSASIAQGGCVRIYRSTGSLQLPYLNLTFMN